MNKNYVIVAVVLLALIIWLVMSKRGGVPADSESNLPTGETQTINNAQSPDYKPKSSKPATTTGQTDTTANTVYKTQNNGDKSPIKFSYPSTWTVSPVVVDRYGLIGQYILKPDTKVALDYIYIDFQKSCDDFIKSDIQNNTLVYFFDSSDPTNGVFVTSSSVEYRDPAVINFPTIKTCASVYSKTTNSNVVAEFSHVVKSFTKSY